MSCCYDLDETAANQKEAKEDDNSKVRKHVHVALVELDFSHVGCLLFWKHFISLNIKLLKTFVLGWSLVMPTPWGSSIWPSSHRKDSGMALNLFLGP